MSDIFISYKREEQAVARKLANALEKEGWTVWWDPKLRAGEHFDDVIEKALNEAKCVIVMWSKLSVNSEYIKAEATEALEQEKLVPLKIENVTLPFRFKRVHTPSLLDWNGSRASPDFRKFIGDISAVLNDSSEITKQAEANDTNQRRIRQDVPNSWRTYGPVVAAMAVVLIIFSFVFWWSKPQEAPVMEAEGQKGPTKEGPMVKAQPPNKIVVAAPEKKPEVQKEKIEQPSLVKIQPEKQITVGKVFRDDLKSGGKGPMMVEIPAGSFQMGDVQGGGATSEVPVRTVKFQKRFAIGVHEVTFEEYDQFAKATNRKLPSDQGWGRDRRPVIYVSWQDAVAYAKWLSAQTGNRYRYRLPTEAEWEYAARAGTETAYWWGKDLVKGMANCTGCGSQWDNKETAPVGSFKPNPFGLYDTVGNVWEWVEDCHHGNYNGAPIDGSAWGQGSSGVCDLRGFRGGAWGSNPQHVRSSKRNFEKPDHSKHNHGFRLAQDID